jgi:hypothetical protein
VRHVGAHLDVDVDEAAVCCRHACFFCNVTGQP